MLNVVESLLRVECNQWRWKLRSDDAGVNGFWPVQFDRCAPDAVRQRDCRW